MSDAADEVQKQWDDLKMRDQIGISADVERNKKGDEAALRANRALNDIGDYIHQNTDAVQQLQYLGSAAVHIYMAPTLNQVVYISQVGPLGDCPERVAGPAFTDLQKSMMAHYGRRTTKIRSGF